jgi:Flp pilus assembly protein TadD
MLFSALSLCAASGPRAQAISGASASHATPAETPDLAVTIAPQPAIAAPTLSEMRSMTAEQLDEEGDRMRQGKDYLSAIDCYRAAIRKHSSAAYYNKIAISELQLRHPEEAEKAAKKAVRKDKRMADAWNNLAVSYYLRTTSPHHLDDAIRTYQRAISLKPDSASFHNNLAAAFMDDKQFDHGLAEYRKAFELDPTFFERTSQSGISAHLSSPQDRAQFSFVMARLFAASGDLDRALHFLRSAMEDGYPRIDEVYRDKEFARALTDERFLELMKDRPVAIR